MFNVASQKCQGEVSGVVLGVTEPDVGDEEVNVEAFYGANSGALFAFIALSSTWLWAMADWGSLIRNQVT